MALAVNPAFAKGNFESSIIAPSLIPRVNYNPMIFPISNDLDGMSSQGASGGMPVNPALVVNEIFVNRERCGHGPVLHQIGFDLVD